MKTKKKLIIVLIILFIPLSYLKLTTAAITPGGQPGYSIVKTTKINFGKNFFSYVHNELTTKERDLLYNTSNSNGLLYVDGDSLIEKNIYELLISLWWIVLLILLYLTVFYNNKTVTDK